MWGIILARETNGSVVEIRERAQDTGGSIESLKKVKYWCGSASMPPMEVLVGAS